MMVSQVNVMNFWNRFDDVRQGTIEDVANGTGIKQGTLRNLRSRRMLPNLADTIAIADYLNVSLDWLVLGKVVESKSEEVNEVMNEYRKSDNFTKLLVQRALKLI